MLEWVNWARWIGVYYIVVLYIIYYYYYYIISIITQFHYSGLADLTFHHFLSLPHDVGHDPIIDL